MRRIKINFTKSTESVDIHNRHLLNSYIHKCLGVNNKYHDSKSDYNISHLYGGKINDDRKTLRFDNGSYIVVSSIHDEFIDKLLAGILSNMELYGGMRFSDVEHINEKFHNGWNNFLTLSPFMIKEFLETDNGIKYRFRTIRDSDFNIQVENHIKNKLSKINSNLKLDDLKVDIPNHISHKVKTEIFRKNQSGRKDIKIEANQCAVKIFTNKEVAKYIYHLGLGMSTGSGFGTIYKMSNRNLYI